MSSRNCREQAGRSKGTKPYSLDSTTRRLAHPTAPCEGSRASGTPDQPRSLPCPHSALPKLNHTDPPPRALGCGEEQELCRATFGHHRVLAPRPATGTTAGAAGARQTPPVPPGHASAKGRGGRGVWVCVPAGNHTHRYSNSSSHDSLSIKRAPICGILCGQTIHYLSLHV